jgi:predicted dehydrogenase
MSKRVVGVAVVGCGNISAAYGKTLQSHSDSVRIVGAFDVDPQRSADFVAAYGGKTYPTLQQLLTDRDVEAVVNLTIHAAHVPVITAAIEAGKHVLTEKPLAVDPEDAWKLVALAEARGVLLASAPTVALGEAQQAAIRAVRQGVVGEVKLVYGEMNWGRPEVWHPNPAPFYSVGAMYDVGVYPLMIATAALGPVASVRAFEVSALPQRMDKNQKPFTVARPEWTCAMLSFACGAVMRLTTVFYNHSKQGGLEFHGDKGTLFLPSNFEYHKPPEVQLWENGNEFSPIPLPREGYVGCEWARGVVELADAIRDNRPSRTPGEQAAHVVEVIAAVHRSASNGSVSVEVNRGFRIPDLMDWAK